MRNYVAGLYDTTSMFTSTSSKSVVPRVPQRTCLLYSIFLLLATIVRITSSFSIPVNLSSKLSSLSSSYSYSSSTIKKSITKSTTILHATTTTNNNNNNSNKKNSENRLRRKQSPKSKKTFKTLDKSKSSASETTTIGYIDGKCPCCASTIPVDQTNVANSARLYFNNAALLNRRVNSDNTMFRDNYRDDYVDDYSNSNSNNDYDEYDYDDGYNNNNNNDNNDNNDETFFRIVTPAPLKGWRTQSKLAVAPPGGGGSSSSWTAKGCSFGLYEPGTHNLIPIPGCTCHHPSINTAVEILTKVTERCLIVPYDEDRNYGQLRYIQLRVERSTDKVELTLVWNAETLKECQPGLSRIVKELKKASKENYESIWHSVWCNTNDARGNAIFSNGDHRWHLVDGFEFVRESLSDAATSTTVDTYSSDDNNSNHRRRRNNLLYFTPQVFRQGNMEGFDVIARHVARAIPEGSKVCELYGGVGLLGLNAVLYHGSNSNNRGLEWLRCSDGNPSNERCFEMSVRSMPEGIVNMPTMSNDGMKDEVRKSGTNFRKDKRGKGTTTTSETKPTTNFFDDDDSKQVVRRGTRATYMIANAAEALQAGQGIGANVLIVDPPRKGLDKLVVSELCQPPRSSKNARVKDGSGSSRPLLNDVHTIIYVSCGFDSFARDCDKLLFGGGGWGLVEARGYVLFPGSDHLETVAVFSRNMPTPKMMTRKTTTTTSTTTTSKAATTSRVTTSKARVRSKDKPKRKGGW